MDGVVTVKSTQLGEWDLEAIQAHADFLSLKDTQLNLKELKASRHTPASPSRTNAEPKDSQYPNPDAKKAHYDFS